MHKNSSKLKFLPLRIIWSFGISFSEYPDFYKEVYALTTPFVLYSDYKETFIRLIDSFLSSTFVIFFFEKVQYFQTYSTLHRGKLYQAIVEEFASRSFGSSSVFSSNFKITHY